MRFLLLLWSLFAYAVDPLIVIDAGHGGSDVGTRGRKPYCEEKRVALQTARLVKKHLTQLGYRTIMTRSVDAYVSLEQRTEIANKAHAELFVSIHFNSARTPKAKGIEIFYFESKENRRRVRASKNLASSILTRLMRRTNAHSRGVKRGNYYVLRETEMPAVIVEGGFISNPEELLSIKNPEYLDQIAKGIADGIDHFFK